MRRKASGGEVAFNGGARERQRDFDAEIAERAIRRDEGEGGAAQGDTRAAEREAEPTTPTDAAPPCCQGQ